MLGVEWVVEASGCTPGALADKNKLSKFLDELIRELPLHPVGEPVWHQFPGTGGLTGLCLLAESHFACHTFPEHGSMTVNLFCCKPRPEFDFRGYLTREFAALRVRVRKLERPYGRLLEATGS